MGTRPTGKDDGRRDQARESGVSGATAGTPDRGHLRDGTHDGPADGAAVRPGSGGVGDTAGSATPRRRGRRRHRRPAAADGAADDGSRNGDAPGGDSGTAGATEPTPGATGGTPGATGQQAAPRRRGRRRHRRPAAADGPADDGQDDHVDGRADGPDPVGGDGGDDDAISPDQLLAATADPVARVGQQADLRDFVQVVGNALLGQPSSTRQQRGYQRALWDHICPQIVTRLPRRIYEAWAGRTRGNLDDIADRYGLAALKGAPVDLPAVVRAFHDFLAANGPRLRAAGLDDDDPLMGGVNSPALEKYRYERYLRARMERHEIEGRLLDAATVHALLSDLAGQLRAVQERLRTQYDEDAAAMIAELLDGMARRVSEQTRMAHTGDDDGTADD